MLSTLLWVPLLVIFAISCPLYIIKSRKQNGSSPLLSLAAVIVSAPFSAAAAMVLSHPIVTLGMKLFMPVTADLTATLVRAPLAGLGKWALAMVLFGIVYPMLNALLGKLLRKLFSAAPMKKGVGAPMAMATALVFSLLYTTPLYCTAAQFLTIAEPVSAIASYWGILQDADQMEDNPLLTIYGSEPAYAAYNCFFSIPLGDAKLTLSDVSHLADTAAQQLPAICEGSYEEKAEALQQLSHTLQHTVLRSDLLYSLGLDIADDLRTVQTRLHRDEAVITEYLLTVLDTTPEAFAQNLNGILDFTVSLLSHEAMTPLLSPDPSGIKNSDLPHQLGRLLNSSPELVAMKTLVMTVSLAKAEEKPIYDTKLILDDLAFCTPLTSVEDMNREGRIYLKLFGLMGPYSHEECIFSHPCVNPMNIRFLRHWLAK